MTWSSFCWISAASSRMRRPSSFSASRCSGGALPIERAVSLALRLASSNCDCSVLRSCFQRDEAIDIGRGVAVLAVELDEFDVIDDEFAVEHGSAGKGEEFWNGKRPHYSRICGGVPGHEPYGRRVISTEPGDKGNPQFMSCEKCCADQRIIGDDSTSTERSCPSHTTRALWIGKEPLSIAQKDTHETALGN